MPCHAAGKAKGKSKTKKESKAAHACQTIGGERKNIAPCRVMPAEKAKGKKDWREEENAMQRGKEKGCMTHACPRRMAGKNGRGGKLHGAMQWDLVKRDQRHDASGVREGKIERRNKISQGVCMPGGILRWISESGDHEEEGMNKDMKEHMRDQPQCFSPKYAARITRTCALPRRMRERCALCVAIEIQHDTRLHPQHMRRVQSEHTHRQQAGKTERKRQIDVRGTGSKHSELPQQ